MGRKKIVALLIVAMVTTFSATVVKSLANEETSNQSLEKNISKSDVYTASVSKFDLYNNDKLDAYNEVFKMDNANIKSITNNGGQYGSSNIQKAIDGNLSTHWETGKPNNNSFINEVNLTFHEVVNLNRIAYAARQDSAKGKGFAEQFEIYASLTEQGDDFVLVSAGKYIDSTGDMVEIKFPSTDFKRLKFKFVKANRDWASASEFMFYKEDEIRDKIKTLFTDGTMSVVSQEYNSVEKIDAFEESMKGHPLYEDFEELTQLAKSLLSDPKQDEVFELEMRGDSVSESGKRMMWYFQDLQVTGRSARPGDKVNVYVDVEPGEPAPVLLYKQSMTQHGGSIHFQLHTGKNEITIPEVDYQANGIPTNIIQGGELFFTNYNSNSQTRAPRVRIEGASYYPVFILGKSNEVEVMRELEEYVAKIEAEPSTTPNIFAVSSNKTLSIVQASYALNWYKTNQKTPKDTAELWDAYIADAMTFWGYDNSKEIHSDFDFRIMPMVKNLTGGVFMNAANGVIGVRPGNQDAILSATKSWGMAHELGHNFDNRNRKISEVSNNIMSLFFESHYKTSTRITEQNLWENKIYPKVGLDDYSNNILYDVSDSTSLTQLAPLWQLYLYDNTYYGRFEQQYREVDFGIKTREDVYRSWVVVASNALQLDLTEFFARHGIYVDDNVKESLAQYPKPDKKLYYLNDLAMNYNGNGFTEHAEVSVSTSNANGKVQLSFHIDDENKDHVLGYEIRRDGAFIGFTSNDSFIDMNLNIGEEGIYVITPYDRKLNPLKEIEVNAEQPHISVNPVITLEVGETFNAKDYVSAYDKNGVSIIDEVNVITNTVNTSVAGEYEVVYQVIGYDNTEYTARAQVNVAINRDYASDLNPVVAQNGWRPVQKDKNQYGGTLSLRRHGITVEYEKGLGLHANAEYVYNIEGSNYDYFEAYVGVDQVMASSPNSSIIFKVLVDGEERFNSGLMRATSTQQYVKVDVRDAREVTLIVRDGDNGNGSDHGTWGEAKFVEVDSLEPNISVNPVITLEMGETFNAKDYVSAYDKNGVSIIDEVNVITNTVNTSVAGEYEVVYQVIDYDKTEYIARAQVNVVINKDYVSDLNPSVAQNGWGTVQKDKNVRGETLSLTRYGIPVEYEKGLGIHANAEYVYNIEGNHYDYFEAYVGVDQAMASSPNSSIIFKVLVDGEERFNSGLMIATSTQQYVKVDVRDAREVTLIVRDGDNGNAADHATWGEAKFVSNSTKPIMKGKDLVYFRYENIDLMADLTATSAFGYDLSRNIRIVSSNIKGDSTGVFTVTYSVTDSNSQSTQFTRKVFVVESSQQLSDLNWKSGTIGYGSIKKDRAVNGTPLQLLNENKGVQSFSKGIGTHAYSEIIYNCEGYSAFDSWVGVDQAAAGQNSSVQFKVYADGVLKAQSDVMRADTPKQYLVADIRGAKELKLVVETAENGNEWDHANWANARVHTFLPYGVGCSGRQLIIDEDHEESQELLENGEETEDIVSNNKQDASDNIDDVFKPEENTPIEESENTAINTPNEVTSIIQEKLNKTKSLLYATNVESLEVFKNKRKI